MLFKFQVYMTSIYIYLFSLSFSFSFNFLDVKTSPQEGTDHRFLLFLFAYQIILLWVC